MKPMLIQAWLKELDAAPKTKGHIKAVMYHHSYLSWLDSTSAHAKTPTTLGNPIAIFDRC